MSVFPSPSKSIRPGSAIESRGEAMKLKYTFELSEVVVRLVGAKLNPVFLGVTVQATPAGNESKVKKPLTSLVVTSDEEPVSETVAPGIGLPFPSSVKPLTEYLAETLPVKKTLL